MAKVTRPRGGNELRIASGGKITAAGTQAATIADVAALTGGEAPTEAEFNALAVKFNAVLAALEGVGILASS
jgi:hypothetical protein